MTKVFVYGTLMEGYSNHGYLKGKSILLGRGVTEGELFHLPYGFPAFIPGGGKVRGEAYEFEDKAVLNSLDRLEGYTEGLSSGLYYREIRAVAMDGGSELDCWVYIYNDTENALSQGIPVPYGDWRTFIE